MVNYVKTHKAVLVIFFAALLMRVAAMFSFENEVSLIYVSDSQTYLSIAHNLIEHGVFSMELSDDPTPDSFRTPLYPFFLIPFVYLETSLYLPVLVQNLIFSLVAALSFLLARRLFSERVAFFGMLLFVLEPTTALISGQVMTEPLFLSSFIPAVLLLAVALKEKNIRALYLGALLLALAALTRPVAFYLFPLIPLAVLLMRGKEDLRLSLKQAALALLIFFCAVSPWFIFLLKELHTVNFSSLSSFDLYTYHGRLFDEWRYSRDPLIADRLSPLDYSVMDTFDASIIPTMQKVGLGYILSHPFEYALYHALRLPRLFTDSGYGSIMSGFSIGEKSINSFGGGFLDTLFSSQAGWLIHQTLREPLLLVLFVGDLFFVLCLLLSLLTLWVHWKETRVLNKVALFLMIILALYAFLASPIGGPRLRIPLNAILFFLAADTVRMLMQMRREGKKHASA